MHHYSSPRARLIAFTTVASLGIALSAYAGAAPHTRAVANAPSHCPFDTTTQGYAVATNQSSYQEGDPVVFCLADNTRTPLFLSGLHPWRIENETYRTAYTPVHGSLVANPRGTNYFVDQWNQMGPGGAPTAPGIYTVVFSSFPGTPFARFAILGSTTSGRTAPDSVSTTALTHLNVHLQYLWSEFGVLEQRVTELKSLLSS